jgi:small subunit ribosomal protein S10
MQKKISFPKKKKRFTILKSPHVHKKARDQFELETHTKILKIKGTSQNIKEFMEILEMKVLTDITYLVSFKKIK